MSDDSLQTHARSLWETLAGVPVTFPSVAGVRVVASPGSQLCPPAWTGIVVLGESAIATVPTQDAVEPVQRALSRIATEALSRPTDLKAVLPIASVLGPAALAYVSRSTFNAPPGTVDSVPHDHPDLRALLDAVSPADADESGIGEITSPAFIVRESGTITAAAGYRSWPAATAHLCVLTAEPARGRGLAKRVAAAAVAHALTAGLLPQWRARPAASRRVAQSLGFRELGTQLSIDLNPARLTDLTRC